MRVALLAVPTLAFAQGDLTPPGAPGPTFKTLQQVEPRVPISSAGFNINQPGSYYLTTNLSVASGFGIRVGADDVSLDLGGWTLTGQAGSTDGISAPFSRTNIIVRNGTVRGFGGMGVNLGFNWGVKVEGVTAVGNLGRGIQVGDESAVINCAAIRNGNQGIQTGTHCEVQGCQSRQNGGNGFFTFGNTTFHDSFAVNNTNNGFEVGRSASLRHCVARSNVLSGILANEHANLSDCTAEANGGAGIVSGRGSFIRDCAVIRNASTGFQGDAASQYSQVNVLANGSRGIWLLGDDVLVQRSLIASNATYGIWIANGSVVSDCLISSNGHAGGTVSGILVSGTRNRIENNTLIRNGPYGIFNGFLGGVTNNLIIRNHASGHTTANIAPGAGNHFTLATGPNVTTNLNPYVNFSLP